MYVDSRAPRHFTQGVWLAMLIAGIVALFAVAERRMTTVREIVDGVEFHRPMDSRGKIHGRWRGVSVADRHLVEEGEAHHGALIWRRVYHPSGAVEWDYREGPAYEMEAWHFAADGTPLAADHVLPADPASG